MTLSLVGGVIECCLVSEPQSLSRIRCIGLPDFAASSSSPSCFALLAYLRYYPARKAAAWILTDALRYEATPSRARGAGESIKPG